MGLGGPFDMPVVYLPEAVSEIKEKTNKDLQALIQEHFAGMNVRAEVRESPSAVHYAIADFIAEQGIDMVVMASHGRSGLTRTILGSVAEQVLRRSTKPVVIVPARE
jgi:nucleotide-binding universal stress UspA family protein